MVFASMKGSSASKGEPSGGTLKMGADSARAGEKTPGIGPAAATVAASAKGNFKPSRRVNMGISLGTYSQRRPDKGVVQAFMLGTDLKNCHCLTRPCSKIMRQD